uniref:Uncharacterized protein n=1 Tax=Tanacetum cinerariifolium TaxID=118510 RepID=A0A699RMJ2_TANCI|nr:hypothetical protein [Tanacetum cinerariifolium]
MVVLYISCTVDPQSNTPLTYILLRAILGVLQIGIRAEVIENQVKNILLDYNRFENIALVKKGLHGTFMHMLVVALVEYIPPEDDVFPAEEQPLPAVASPIAESPGYIPESDPDEDPEEEDDEDPNEDPTDYPADHDDEEEEEPFGDDADEEDEEQDEDDDDEEEEHPASSNSIPPPPALRVTARISFRP